MIKTTITPQNDNLNITIPKNYIGKKIEILLYSFDELEEKTANPEKKPSDFFGTLTQQEGEKFHAYLAKEREEWDRNI